jgi:K+ transporter
MMARTSGILTGILAISPWLLIPFWFSPRFGFELTSEFLMGTVSVILWCCMLNLGLALCIAWLRRYKGQSLPGALHGQSKLTERWITRVMLIWSAILAFLGILSVYQMPGVLALARWSVWEIFWFLSLCRR